MTPMEAWSIVSANLAHLVRIRRCQGDPKGYVDAESEAEVITFRALKEMQERMPDIPFMAYSQRRRLAALYKKWCRDNMIKDCPESVIAFMQTNNLINIGNAVAFLDSQKEVNTDV